MTSMLDSPDLFGSWMYRHNNQTLERLIDSDGFEPTTMKSKIALGKYDEI